MTADEAMDAIVRVWHGRNLLLQWEDVASFYFRDGDEKFRNEERARIREELAKLSKEERQAALHAACLFVRPR